jgi:hypothetical protein
VFQDDFEMLGVEDSKAGGKLTSGLEKEVDINPLSPNKRISCIRFDVTYFPSYMMEQRRQLGGYLVYGQSDVPRATECTFEAAGIVHRFLEL